MFQREIRLRRAPISATAHPSLSIAVSLTPPGLPAARSGSGRWHLCEFGGRILAPVISLEFPAICIQSGAGGFLLPCKYLRDFLRRVRDQERRKV